MRRARGASIPSAWAALSFALVLSGPAFGGAPADEQYRLHCSGCHGPDGRGDPRVVPSLRAIGPFAATLEGRRYLVRVPGVAQAPLPSAELAGLLNYVLAELAEASGFEPFTAAEVEAGRQAPLRDPLAMRPATIPEGAREGRDEENP